MGSYSTFPAQIKDGVVGETLVSLLPTQIKDGVVGETLVSLLPTTMENANSLQ
jgi:hypothetical protein